MALFSAACSTGRGPAVERPEPSGSEPVREPMRPAEPLPMVSSFRYAPGFVQYEILTESTIRQEVDTADTSATVRTRALVSLLLDSLATDSLRVEVRLDSVEAERDSVVPAPDSLTSSAASFTALIDAQGISLDSAVVPAEACAPGDRQELLAVARDLLIEVPDALRVGAQWSDTTTVAICRGGVPVTSGVVRHYEVLEPMRDSGGSSLARVEVNTTFSMAGTQTTSLGQVIALSGSGQSRAILELDPAAGLVRSAMRDGTSRVTVTYGRSSTPFVQQVTQRVRLVR